MTKIKVVEALATEIRADALVATIDPSGWGVGGIHDQIMSVSGNVFHLQVLDNMPLISGQMIFCPCYIPHKGRYNSVIFFVNVVGKSTYDVITEVLDFAAIHKVKSLAIPTYDIIGDLGLLAKAIADFKSTNPSSSIEQIIVVVSNKNDKYLLDDELWLV